MDCNKNQLAWIGEVVYPSMQFLESAMRLLASGYAR